MSPSANFGISAFGYTFGRDQDVEGTAGRYTSHPERVVKWGFRTYHRADDDVQTTHLAGKAASQALDRLGISADTVDLVVLACPDVPEYLYWDGSVALARELKIQQTQTLMLTEGCGAGVHGFYYVAAAMTMQPEINTALFVAVSRVSEFHRNRMNTVGAPLSDAAVAVVLERDHKANRWLATEQFTEPEHGELLRVEYGGAVNPLPPAGWTSREALGGYDALRMHFGEDGEELSRYLQRRYDGLSEVIDRTCRRAGIGREEIDHLIYFNDTAASIQEVAESFGIPPEHTNAVISPDHGHMGAADQMISFGIQLERGVVKPGDIVALSGISVGRWCTTLFRA
ncbi:3-oxoacyl-ACP synthase III family protein [Streptomonospora salina]|uniref:3-oxoacyl-[acyl-carrier-protein] synthase-3 n=1 Tax=Streptomonospora salina TaxID=104205 RepID=A0A841EC84_9ACTN|nr:3-oxoacyl-[acyl-carrier-protein] synthase III C-terminal domain-containing protein [Streptomonospora salina]MBB6000024.1 3-oxoacyl-[acyl-carrier-protein] synthase-3 [Streptomonospora salina]